MHTPHREDIKQWCKRRLPILEWAPQYNLKENLLPDTVSGIMLAVQQVAQGKCAFGFTVFCRVDVTLLLGWGLCLRGDSVASEADLIKWLLILGK
jgi:hypothetical protein